MKSLRIKCQLYLYSIKSTCAVGAGNGNENKVELIFSNNPNKGGEGDKGTTPEDKVVVFTYSVPVEKIDGTTEAKLKDVEFKFKNAAGKYVTVDSNGKVTGWVDTEDAGSVLKTDENGAFSIVGLDDGTYTLIETKPLPGYNEIDPITVVINANTEYSNNWDGVQSSVSSSVDIKVGNDSVTGGKIVVENYSGAVLPSTGGRGTTLFYVIGGILVVGAGVLLVTKRRMAR